MSRMTSLAERMSSAIPNDLVTFSILYDGLIGLKSVFVISSVRLNRNIPEQEVINIMAIFVRISRLHKSEIIEIIIKVPDPKRTTMPHSRLE